MSESSSDKEDESEDLEFFREKAKNTKPDKLESDLAELFEEIQFMIAQVEADVGSYTPADLERFKEKILRLRKKAEVAKRERAKIEGKR